MTAVIDIRLPPWARAFRRPARYKIAYGGRGSAKSWTFARLLLLRAVSERLRILCTRELQNSIQDSVHQLLADQIAALGLEALFEVLESRIRSASGSEFLFKGLRGMHNNASALKSLEAVDLCWIEEGQTVSGASLKTLTPTIRAPGAEIWITFNPDQASDPVYQLVREPPPDAIVRQVNWDANPWFHQTSLPAERDWMLRTDPEAYAHVWEGACRTRSDAQVLRGKWRVEAFAPGADWDGPYYGADWGFAKDPTVLVRLWIAGARLYVEHEAYGIGVELDDTPLLFDAVPAARAHVIRADAARPETIRHLQRKGFGRLQAAAKWPGSVEDGVAFLRSFEAIVIHPRCTHTAEEARLWSFKTDRLNGDVLPVLVDAHNHCWDAVRYALQPLIRRRASAGHLLQVAGL